jgi:hypothetical protein
MRNWFLKAIGFCAVFAVCGITFEWGPPWALGAPTVPTVQVPDVQTVLATPALSNIALNAAAAARTTSPVLVEGRTEVTAYIQYNRGATAAATHITLACWAGRSKGRMGPMVILYDSPTLGTRDSLQHVWRQAVAADAVVRFILTPLNDAYLRCLVGSEGVVTADDVIERIDFRLGKL